MHLFIDESGNTQSVIVLALVAIPENTIDAVNQLFTLRPYDPPEIHALYQRPDKNKHARAEFKYSDFKNAFRATNLRIYEKFLGKKFEEIAQLDISAYLAAFPNPGNQNNEERLLRLQEESNWLLQKWGHQNIQEALSSELRIFCDQQIYRDELDFLAIKFREKNYMLVGQSGKPFKTPYYPESIFNAPRQNRIKIAGRSSKSCKPLQLADFIAGSFRDKMDPDLVFGFFDALVPRIVPRHHIRLKIHEYELPKWGHLNRNESGYER